MLSAPAATVRRARALRREMSLPEVMLRRLLRDRPAGLKFRRQHPIGHYVADFFCAQANLAVEVDGTAHDFGDRPARDMARDAWFTDRGITVMRVVAGDILRDPEAALTWIIGAAMERLPLHQPAAGPPPRAGEDWRRKRIVVGVLLSVVGSTSASLTAIAIDHLVSR